MHLLSLFGIILLCQQGKTSKNTVLNFSESKKDDLESLRNIFRPAKDVLFTTGYGKNVPEDLERISKSNISKAGLLLKGSLYAGNFEDVNSVDLSLLQHMDYLEEFWLSPHVNKAQFAEIFFMDLVFKPINSSLRNTISLKRLFINIHLEYLYDTLPLLLEQIKELEVLSLKGIKCINVFTDLERILRNMNTKSLKALSLASLLRYSNYQTEVNLTKTLKSLQSTNLEYLDLSSNYISAIYGSITDMWPNLRILDLSDNMLIDILNTILIGEIITFHPELEVVNLDAQISAGWPKWANHTKGILPAINNCIAKYNHG